MPEAIIRKRIAILGGGVGAMTAAFEITESPDWQEKYELTVYQLGWRLGGKGASGRNRRMNDRIEEHGLHLWFGYYENAFNIIQRCYGALDRPPGSPLATWQDAFHKHNLFILFQFHNAQWSQWRVDPPAIGDEVPGDGQVPPIWELVDRLLAFLHHHFESLGPPAMLASAAGHPAEPNWLTRSLEWLAGKTADAAAGLSGLTRTRDLVQRLAADPLDAEARTAVLAAIADVEDFVGTIRAAVETLVGSAAADELADHPTLYRLLSLLELGFYMFKGIIVDDVADKGFDQLDHLDLREWLASHGAGKLALDSDSLRVAYESIFAFKQGSYAQPNLAAGVGLRGLLRLCFTYKGAFAYKMQAGMGDTVFTPFYQALVARGVKFEFFSRVEELVPSADGTRIDSIRIARQATVLGPTYNPLYPVKGLMCWPSEPDYTQLKEGPQLEKDGINLESWWTSWPDVGHYELHAGQHFDEVILGISAGALPYLCPKLVEQKSAWQLMVANVDCIQTQAFQIWTNRDETGLRKPPPNKIEKLILDQPVYGGFAQPHNTTADMTHLLDRENWPADKPPGALYYFCGPLAQVEQLPSKTDYYYPKDQSKATKDRASQWLKTNLQFVLPGSMFRGYPESFPDTLDFGILYDVRGSLTPQILHFDSQYWRTNIDPSELYVLSTKGSTQYRIRGSNSGYANMVLAGDWTFTALNYGCVEAAVMSGMEASRAICGYPTTIFGDHLSTKPG